MKYENISLCINALIEYLQHVQFPIVIAVSGGSCSGKTYFSQQLSQALLHKNITSVVISLDSYFKDIDDNTLPRDQNGRRIFDSIDSYHVKEFIEDVNTLLRGNVVCIPQYDMCQNKRVTRCKKVCQLANIIIAEGLFVSTILQKLSCNMIDVFLDVSVDTLLQRRIERDIQKYGVSAQVVRERFESDVMSIYKEKIEKQKNNACIIVHNDQGGENNART